MKTYKNFFNFLMLPETVRDCALDAAEGKLHRPEVIGTFKHLDDTYELVTRCARDPNYQPCEDNRHEIIDGANHKPREIEKPMFCPEQILHHMIIEPFKQVLLNGLYEQVYGCLPPTTKIDKNGKVTVKKYGPHNAIHQLKKWIQSGQKTYVCEMDIHHAYGSVHIATLVKQLKRVIKDKDWIRLTCQFLHYKENDPESEELCGLVLGHYTSPWFFNFYLKTFDHFAATLDGVKYLRFADNFFLVGTNKRKVHRALNDIKQYLKQHLRLELNGSTQVYRFEYVDKFGKVCGRAVNALGAVIHHNRTTLRKSILKRMRRKAIRIAKKKDKVTWHDGSSMFSRLSWLRYTDIHTYYSKYIRPRINIRLLKSKVSAHSKFFSPIYKKRRQIIYDGLEKSSRLTSGETK